jgi:hypothetical protein
MNNIKQLSIRTTEDKIIQLKRIALDKKITLQALINQILDRELSAR